MVSQPEYLAGYPTFKGQVLNGQQLGDLIAGLEENNLLYYTHLLTGMFILLAFLIYSLKIGLASCGSFTSCC